MSFGWRSFPQPDARGRLSCISQPLRFCWERVCRSDRTIVRIGMFKENPLTILQIFVSEQRELIQSSIHFYGKKVRVGSYLREYDYSKREFIKLPWRVTRIDSYLPEPHQSPDYCYAAIHIAHCVRVALLEVNSQKACRLLITFFQGH